MIGSEGLLAVATEITVKLLPKPHAARVVMASFDDVQKAGDAVAAVIAAGIIPAGLEMMDKPATHAVEQFVGAGYDLDAAAILLCESDGMPEEVEDEVARMKAVLEGAGATRITVSGSEAERLKFWSGRKAAFPAVGRISPDYYCMDGTIPRKRLGEVLHFIGAMEKKYGLRCPNVFHAGDGNLHPLILFDANDPDQLRRTEAFAGEVLEKCVAVGGTITGEHGVGVEKIDQMCVQFGAAELETFHAIKRAFDPRGLLNPGKAIPTLRALRRVRAAARAWRPAAAARAAALLMLADFQERIRAAAGGGTPLRLRGSGSKDFYGGELAGEVLDTRGHAGIVSYEPTELVVTARCGTRLDELEATLAANGQMLAFEPPHFGAQATLGGCVAAGLSGPRRAAAGAVRDFVLGARLLDGRARELSFGGQVMKNVAGYDVSRLLAGSLGTLGLILEVSLKVLPRPAAGTDAAARAGRGRRPRSAQSLGRPAAADYGERLARWRAVPAAFGRRERGARGGEGASAARPWRTRGRASASTADPYFAGDVPLWRLSVPSHAPALGLPGDQMIEWGGALRWLRTAADAGDSARRGAAGRRACDAVSRGTTRRRAPLRRCPRCCCACIAS